MTESHSPVPAVSLILVNYNAGPLLTDAVGAALASSVPVEVIVSDNGSRDDSLERLRRTHGRDERLRILENGANLGFAAANNRALPLARAERLLFLNPDCLVAPDTLERLIAILDAHPEVGMIGCLVCDPDGTEQVACRRAIPDPWIALQRLLRLDRLNRSAAGRRLDQRHQPLPTEPVEVEAISGSFMLTTRRALEQVGPLDAGYFLHCEDLDWFVRFQSAGLKILFVPNVSVIHHKGACSTGDPLAVERHKHRGMVRFFRKHQMQRYSRLFGGFVIVGIWVHFGLKAVVIRLGSRSRA
ncbi:glycosyltransferase family 2 protein [Allochromatium vinosum]|uniref:Glycosyl transferase family 2 n=1 Tax=Allochromatium vinosum (strain ATCC 17899 / DSM 180 / NBRC 103801 / NCIMB 10441 / D) TaxID=572477 RepID=D3RUX5_ALLVD|nr:glycosyltransferase family 2 protein [Allochromatium vinosum]ADC61024.1 glycosyl transferase family 2 [Allochromatium vinosum DSM 180]